MPNTREKLIELLNEAEEWADHKCDELECETCPADKMKSNCVQQLMVDRLIANGVTFATDNNVGDKLTPTADKWIPVSERLPEDTLPKFSAAKQIKVLTALKSDNGVRTVRSQMRYRDAWCDEVRWRWKYSGGEVTHWMPLPEAPKGE